jgi:hypothetical protein
MPASASGPCFATVAPSICRNDVRKSKPAAMQDLTKLRKTVQEYLENLQAQIFYSAQSGFGIFNLTEALQILIARPYHAFREFLRCLAMQRTAFDQAGKSVYLIST